MTPKLSDKDRRLKEQMEQTLASGDMTWFGRGRRIFSMLPHDPRCASCMSPFEGPGGAFVRAVLNKRRSQTNPLFCTECEDYARKFRAGVETEMSMLFADIRGSTTLAERMPTIEFKQLIDRFYSETTYVLAHSYALFDKLAGDQVSGYYLPGYVGKEHAKRSVEAAQKILQVTGHGSEGEPWAPVGVGINTGRAYFGVVGEGDETVEFTALGDEVNVAARLASQAAAGEIVISERAAREAELDTPALEKRSLELKGKSEPVNAYVIKIASS